MVLNGQDQLVRRFVELTFQEIRLTHHRQGGADRLAGAQPHGGLEMLDCEIVLASKCPEKTANKPAASEARVERERPVNQPNHCADVFAEIPQHVGRVGEDTRVALPSLERLPREVDAFAARRPRLFSPSVSDERRLAERRPCNCWPVIPIDRDCLL